MLATYGNRTRVMAKNLMKGDEMIMAGEENVFISSIEKFSTKYRNPSQIVVAFRTPKTGRVNTRVFEADQKVSIIETDETHSARRANSRLADDAGYEWYMDRS